MCGSEEKDQKNTDEARRGTAEHRVRLDVAVPHSEATTVNEDSISCVDCLVSLEEEGTPERLSKFEHMKQMTFFPLKN